MVQTACYGMAGSFGCKEEHSEASRTQDEREVFAAVRSHPEALAVTTGVSCRHQIEDFTGRHPINVVEALRAAVRTGGTAGTARGAGTVGTVEKVGTGGTGHR